MGRDSSSHKGLESLKGTVFSPSRLLMHERVRSLYEGKDKSSPPTPQELLGVYPIALEIGTSGKCNSGCSWCNHKAEWANNRGNLPLEDYTRLIDEVSNYTLDKKPKAIIYSSSGEPTMNRDFPEMVRYTAARGIDTALITNGTNFYKPFFKGDEIKEVMVKHGTWLRVSLNAGTSKTREEVHVVRPDDFEQVLNQMRVISEMIEDPRYISARERDGLASRLHLGGQIVVEPRNAHEVREFVRRVKETGAAYAQIKPVVLQVHDKAPEGWDMERGQLSSRFWRPVIEASLSAKKEFEDGRFEVYFKEDQFGGLTSKSQGRDAFDTCRAMFAPVFETNSRGEGEVYYCSQTRGNPNFLLGNLKHQTFKEIWEGEQRRRVWEQIALEECQIFCRNWSQNAELQRLHEEGLVPGEIERIIAEEKIAGKKSNFV